MKKCILLNFLGLGISLSTFFMYEFIYVLIAYSLLILILIYIVGIGIYKLIYKSIKSGILIILITAVFVIIEIVLFQIWVISITASVGDW